MANDRQKFTQALAEFIADQAINIPGEAFEHAKVAFMDWLAVTVAGKDETLVDKLLRYAQLMGGHEQASVIGRDLKASVSQAALINGAASHALDYDDTIGSYIAHPSVTLFPALLALSEFKEKSGQEFLTAYLIGFQAGATVGRSAGMDHYLAGWHATSTIGTIASAAACARLLGLDVERAMFALGIGATQSSGLKIMFGTDTKPFHAGRASQSGLLAALLAQENFTAAPDVLEGPQGFFQAFSGAPDTEALARLGVEWDVANLAQKYHASCHATHSPIEAARSILADGKISLGDVKKIRVRVSQLALDIAGREDPKTALEAKFSIAFCVANALVHDDTGMMAFSDERIKDPAVREAMKRIEVGPGSEVSAMEAEVSVETDAGKVLKKSADVLADELDLSVKQQKVRDKFKDLVGPVWGEHRSADLVRQIGGLETIENMGGFARTLASPDSK